jgi:repressor LexA
MSSELTDRQRQAYAAIRDHLARHGVTPKLHELGRALGIRSRGVVHRHVQALVAAGLVEVEAGRHRGIRLLDAEPVPGAMELASSPASRSRRSPTRPASTSASSSWARAASCCASRATR